MGKSVKQIPQDPFAFKPEYNKQVAGTAPASAPAANDPFSFRPEYNADVKKKVGGTESEVGIIEPSPTQSELQSKKETATDFLVTDINKNDFFSQLAAETQRYFPNTTPQRVNQQAAEMTQKDVFNNPSSLQRYNGDRLKALQDQLKDIERQKNEITTERNQAVANTRGGKTKLPEDVLVKYGTRMDDLSGQEREINSYIKKLKSSVAEVAADQILSKVDLRTVSPSTLGRQLIQVADPELEEKFQLAEKSGQSLPGIQSEQLERLGIDALKSYLARNPDNPFYKEGVRMVNNFEHVFDYRNPEQAALRVKEKLGAEIYKEGKSAWFGFGYKPQTLRDIAEKPETALTESEKKIFYGKVLPEEEKMFGSNIPTSGFTRSLNNAIVKNGAGIAKTIGDLTGLRDESDQAQDLLNREVAEARYRPAGESPTAQGQLAYLNEKEKREGLTEPEKTQKKELENYTYVRNGWSKFKDGVGDLTGQVAMIAMTTKGLGAAGKAMAASGETGGLLGGMTRGTIGQALSNETVGLFVTSYLNAYDNYKQQAIDLMPGKDKAANREAYATAMSAVEGLSERIFRDTKILDAFTNTVAPSIREITNKLVNREITQQLAKEEAQKALTTSLKTFGKEYVKATGQESSEEAIVDLANGIAVSVFGGQEFDLAKTGQEALNTFLTTALYSPLVAGMAAAGASRRNRSQNAFLKSSIVDMAANPAQYLKSVEDLQLDGTITQQQANEKIKLINSAKKYLQEIPASRPVAITATEGQEAEAIETEKAFDYPEISSYLIHRLNEGILTEQINETTDEVLRVQLTKQLRRSQEIRKGLFDGSISVTTDLQDVTDNPEKAADLGIFDANQLQKDELIGTPFESVPQKVPQSTVSEEGQNGAANEPVNVSKNVPQSQSDEQKSEDQNTQTAPAEGQAAPAQGTQGQAPQITDEQRTEAARFANELKTEGIIPDTYSQMITDQDATPFWQFVAQQAQNVDEQWQPLKGEDNLSEQAAIDAFGETVVDYAKELFPITKIQVNETGQSQESGSQEAGQASEESNSGISEEEAVLETGGAEPVAGTPSTETAEEPVVPVAAAAEGQPMSGITHEQTEETRKEFGLGDSYEKNRKADEDLEKQADAEIKKGYDIEGLISKIEKGTIPTDIENTILKKYKASLEAQIQKNPSDENIDQLKRLVQATDKIGSETGRALRSRQGMELRDDSLAAFFIQDINANLQAPLTEAQKEKVITEHEKINNDQKAYDEKIEKLEAENARLRAEAAVKKLKSATKKSNKTHSDFVEERKRYIEDAKEKLKKLRNQQNIVIVPYANELFAIAPDVARIVKSLVEEGVTNLSEIIKSVHDTFKEVLPELTEADVNNIIAGEYAQKKTRTQVAETMRDLRDEAALVNKLEALLNGERPKNEKGRIKRNQQIEELRKKIKDFESQKRDAERKAKDDAKEKRTPEEIALDNIKRRTKAEIDKLQKQIDSGDFADPPKKEPIVLDKEAIQLKDKLVKSRQERQIRLLKMEYANRSKTRKAFDAAANILNVPRSLMASLDFSAPLRQAAIVTVNNPKVAANAGLEMFRQAWSQKRFDRWFFDLQETPRYDLMQNAGLYVADPHDPRLTVREEQFISNLAQKIPLIGRLVSGSERAYVAYLNKMRVDLFNRYADALEADGFTWSNHPEMYEGLAKFLNNSTGRGDLGGLEAAAPFLNTAFFSPRLMASRLNILGLNPTYYKALPPQIRKEALKNLGLFIGVGVATLSLLAIAFGCDDAEDKSCLDVEVDPRSSDFGKIRSGKTRWDIWGGFQQYIRLMAQLVSGQTKTVTTGEIKELDGEGISRSRADQLFAFFRGKLAPVPSFVVDRLAGGRNVVGEKQSFLEAAGGRLLPLVASDLSKSIKDNGVRAIFTQGIPAIFGVGVQNYLPRGYEDKNMKDPVYNFLYDKGINMNVPSKKEGMSEDQYEQFLKEREPIIKSEWDQAMQYGIMINDNGNATIDENAAVKIVPANKATYEQLTQLMKSISNKATREVQRDE
jgi:hypothetical protein